MSAFGNKVNFIAEVSANHLGSLTRAKDIVKAAAKAGATSVKFQTYTAETMTLDLPEFAVSTEHEIWGGRKLYDLYEEAHTPWEWHQELFSLARELGVIPFSSPFDLTAVNFLESLDCPVYKIASLETGDHRLIEAVARTGKPIIMSTGATEWQEIQEAVEVIQNTGNRDLTLLLCTSSYPASPRDSQLSRMQLLKDEFNCKVGLSDHTLGIGVSVAAIALGAQAIEKHLTLDRADGGADGAFSMEPEEFEILVNEGSAAALSIGQPIWKVQESEYESRRLRRSLYLIRAVEAGEEVTHENVRAIRPGGGAAPRILQDMIGRKFKESHSSGFPFTELLVE